jgi:hypothetical protein
MTKVRRAANRREIEADLWEAAVRVLNAFDGPRRTTQDAAAMLIWIDVIEASADMLLEHAGTREERRFWTSDKDLLKTLSWVVTIIRECSE